MNPKNRAALAARVAAAAEAAVAADKTVSVIDVLMGIRWLEPSAEKRWRQGLLLERQALEAVGADLGSRAVMPADDPTAEAV
jgi:hypothetical protein